MVSRPKRKREKAGHRYECQFPHCKERNDEWTCGFDDRYGQEPEPNDGCPLRLEDGDFDYARIRMWLYDFEMNQWVSDPIVGIARKLIKENAI